MNGVRACVSERVLRKGLDRGKGVSEGKGIGVEE